MAGWLVFGVQMEDRKGDRFYFSNSQSLSLKLIFAKTRKMGELQGDRNLAFNVILGKVELRESSYRSVVQCPTNAKLPFVRKKSIVGDQ